MSFSPPWLKPMQFPLRTLFIVLAIAAVLLAIVGPQYRTWTPGQRTQFLVTWCTALAFIMGNYALMAVMLPQRYGAESAGDLWLRLSRRSRWQRVGQAAIVLWLLLLFVYSWPSWSFRLTRNATMPTHLWLGFLLGVQMGGLAPSLWKQHYGPEVREHGLLVGPVLFKWSDILAYHWSADDQNQLVIQAQQSKNLVTIPVPPKAKQQVVEILQKMVPAPD